MEDRAVSTEASIFVDYLVRCDGIFPSAARRMQLMSCSVSLPELLAQTNMDQQSVSRLREELTKFTNWLSKNGQKYFVREYEVPGPEYQDKAKSS